MKTIPTVEGKIYCVNSTTECTITSESGTVLGTVTPGQPFWFQAQKGNTTTLSDANAEYSASRFNAAPQQWLAIRGVLGGNAGNGGLPAGYTRVEYLEATGVDNPFQGPYIFPAETISVDSSFSLKGSWARTTADSSTATKLFGFYRYDKMTRLQMLFFNEAGAAWDFRTVVADSYLSKNIAEGDLVKPHVCSFDILRKEYEVDGESRTFEYNADLFNLWLVGQQYSVFGVRGSVDGTYSFDAPQNGTRVFAFTHWKGSKKVVDFVPALDATGAPCMFDLVSRKPFYNAGTGDFLYPTERTTYALRRVLPDWGKLTEHGLRRLYHAPEGYTGELVDYALENGYKPIVEPEQPTEGYWAPRWTETEDEIVLEWVETEPPMDEPLNETE